MKNKYLLIAAVMLGFTANAQFTANNLLVESVGDGATTLSNASAPVSLVEVNPAGSVVQTVSTPFTGANLLTESGTAGSNGMFNVYNNFVGVPGYNSALGTPSVASTDTKVAHILNNSAIVTSRALFPTSGTMAFKGNNLRSVVPVSANTFYATGNGSSSTGGVWYYDGTNFTQISTTVTNLRNVEIYNGNLYFSTGSGTPGIYQVGTGLPTTSGQTATSIVNAGTGASPYGFSISPDGNTMYIADDNALTSTGGVSKWTNSGGTWTKQYNFAYQTRGLVVDYSGANPVIYATTTESSNNKIIKIVDTGSTATATDIVTAGANYAFKGIDFTPNSTVTLAVNDVKKSNFSIAPSLVNAGEIVNFSEKTNFEIYNTNGQKVSEGKNAKTFSTTGFAPGMYIVKIGGKTSAKILVK